MAGWWFTLNFEDLRDALRDRRILISSTVLAVLCVALLMGSSIQTGIQPVSQSGTWNVNASATQSGPWTVAATQSGPWNVGQSGTWNVNAVQSGTWNVNAAAAQSGSWTVGATQSGPWTVAATQSGAYNVGAAQLGSWNVGQTGTWNVNAAQSGSYNVGQTGTWTVQPGNTPNTNPWLFVQSSGSGSNTQQNVDNCQSGMGRSYLAINQTTNTKLLSGSGGQQIYVCSFNIVVSDAENVAVVEGTGSVCGTSTAAMPGLSGGTSAANGWNFAANGGISGLGNGGYAIAKETTTGDDLCLLQSGSGKLSGGMSYVYR